MLVKDLMRTEVVTVREDLAVGALCDVLQQANVHGVPVVDERQRLVGFVSQEDILFGSLGGPPWFVDGPRNPGEDDVPDRRERVLVRDIMTAPAISTGPGVDVRDVGRLLWRLRIHHVPVIREGRILGIVSSMDYCRLIGEGDYREGAS